MNKKTIAKIQKRILELLPKEKRQKKALLLADCCSELSRLMSCWLNELDEFEHQIILKGVKIFNTNKSHDILASCQNGKVYLFDPTIWQFFPDKESIFVGQYPTINEALAAATNKYGGHWFESEKLCKISHEEKDEWLRIIKKNI